MIKFGTSGFRGIIGDNFTKENVQKVAYAIAKSAKTKKEIVVGYDNRFMGFQFACWVSEVLTFYGIKVKFFNTPVPSPLIAFETKNKEFGIMITASHNPYYYSGMKIFEAHGKELTQKRNANLAKIANKVKYEKIGVLPLNIAKQQGLISYTTKIDDYCKAIISSVDKKQIKNANLKVVYNAMHGSSVDCAKKIFGELGIKVGALNIDIDPNFNFGLPAPYEKNLRSEEFIAKVCKDEDFSFALDGDGDRVSFIDEKGVFYDCNYITALIYDDFFERGLISDIVKNCAMTSLIDKIAEKYGRKVILAEVGFKNTAEKLLSIESAVIGAESNGIAMKSHIYYKDGLFASVLVANIIARRKKSLGTLIKELKKKYKYPCEVVEYAYEFNNVQKKYIQKTIFEDKKLPKTKMKIERTDYSDGLKIYYPNGYWGEIRFSGNENVIRLFAEMPNKKQAEEVIAIYEKLIKLKVRQV